MRPETPGAPNREKRWSRLDSGKKPSRSVLIALLLASATLITLDHQTGEESPLEQARQATGEVLGPVESFTAAVVRPFTSVPDYFRSRHDLRAELQDLEAENAQLRRTVRTTDLDRNRLAEYDGLTRAATDTGHDLVPARVVGIGSAQSFSHTVTIDAGASSGLRPDMTVLNNDGLVGRIIRTTRTTATVLLLLDTDSVVGGRLGPSLEIGFLRGRGNIGETGRLDLELADDAVVVNAGDVVTSWGSKGGAPYVAGVPIGRVVSVYNSPRETTRRAVIEPFVDYSSLDLVGVVVPGGTDSDRTVIRAEEGR